MTTRPTLTGIRNALLALADASPSGDGILIKVTETNFWQIAEILELPESSNDNKAQVCDYLLQADVETPQINSFILTDEDLKAMPALLEADVD